MGLEEIRKLKENANVPKEKKVYRIPKKSAKKIAQEKADKEAWVVGGSPEREKEKWFQARRKEMTGTCQCGCGTKSSKHEDDHFRSSAAHIFPQRLFPTIQFHPLNWVERNFWEGHHSNMDNRSMELWPNFADWDDIKEKFHILSPLLTEKERAKKFFRNLTELVEKN